MTSRNKREGRFAACRKTGLRYNAAQWAYRKNQKLFNKIQGRLFMSALRAMPDILPEEFLAGTVFRKVTALENGNFKIERINPRGIYKDEEE